MLLVEEITHRLMDADASDDADVVVALDAWVASDPTVGELVRTEAWMLVLARDLWLNEARRRGLRSSDLLRESYRAAVL